MTRGLTTCSARSSRRKVILKVAEKRLRKERESRVLRKPSRHGCCAPNKPHRRCEDGNRQSPRSETVKYKSRRQDRARILCHFQDGASSGHSAHRQACSGWTRSWK